MGTASRDNLRRGGSELLQESRLTVGGISIERASTRSSRKDNLLYVVYFLPIFFLIRLVTSLLVLVRFKRLLARAHRMLPIKDRVLYLEVFFPENAGFHYRVQKWIEVLRERGIIADAMYVFERERHDRLIRDQRIVFFQTVFLFRRVGHCIASLAYNCVIVRRELLLYNDYGDLFLEKFLLALHPNVILDFDDDISAAKQEPRKLTRYGRFMRESPSKFGDTIRLYRRFIAGSNYLKSFVLEASPGIRPDDVVVIPTCVDYEKHSSKVQEGSRECVNFGWIGSNATIGYLDIVIPALREIAKRRKIRLIVVSGQDFKADVDFEIINICWSLKNEIEDLNRIDIGLMPLYDAAAEKGKCGFKLIQYMGLGIVSIASDVTVNGDIIDDKQNGFLVRSECDWVDVIEEALARVEEFPAIGLAARKKIRDHFSFEANKQKYLSFIEAPPFESRGRDLGRGPAR
jgi:glycosyltransferase involved in cell wall biosynthesis